MSYTWQDGELITAEKLNQTGGGSGTTTFYMNFDEDGDGWWYIFETSPEEVMAAFLSTGAKVIARDGYYAGCVFTITQLNGGSQFYMTTAKSEQYDFEVSLFFYDGERCNFLTQIKNGTHSS